jgi:HD-GYP domain-containing protein (c-di-GMP phosphodiesterase class II)
MTSDRPHQPALEPEEALAELERGAGTQFDPAVVEAFREELGLRVDDARSPELARVPELAQVAESRPALELTPASESRRALELTPAPE